jgi:hypothetical protein
MDTVRASAQSLCILCSQGFTKGAARLRLVTAGDRVNQYMIREVCHHMEACTAADCLFQIVASRMFSKPIPD